MRIGYGVGDGDTTIQTTRRRWLILLLAFLLGAALVLVATNTFTPAPVHAAEVCPDEGPDGGKVDEGGDAVYDLDWVVCVKAGANLVNVTADGTSTLQVLLDAQHEITKAVSHHTVISIPNSPPEITEILAPTIGETGGEVTVTASFTDPDAGDTHSCTFEWGDTSSDDVVLMATSPCSFSHSYAEPDVYTVTVTVEDAGGLTDSETATITVFDVPCEAGATCAIGGTSFTGTITCDEFCGVNHITIGGDVVDVVATSSFMIVYESVGKGTNPGSASVEKEGFGDLPSCGKKGTDPTTNCVHINRVNGNHTQYIVFFTNDPRFRFR